jgi:hypothetical protein
MAFETDRAACGTQEPGDRIDERRLAGAIGAEDGNRFSGAQANADFVERLVPTVGVAQPEHFKHGAGHAFRV